MLFYLIDGNNVIRANPEWDRLFVSNPDNAKNYFVQKVVDYFRGKKNIVTIFFDGFSFDHSFTKVSNNVNLKHAKNKTADEIILITIEKTKNKKNIVVVTDDKSLSSKIKLYQCRLISSQEFIKSLISYENRDIKQHENLSKSEIEYWLRLFQENKNRD